MWDPVNGSPIDECIFGNGASNVPIPGIGMNGDLYSDMAFYNGTGFSGQGMFSFRNSTPSTPGSCPGPDLDMYHSFARQPGTRVFAVADMTGDGKPEIMVINPGSNVIYWLKS